MSENELEILNTIKNAWPNLDALQRARLLGFGEGLAFTALAARNAAIDEEPAVRPA